jgi:hypothetical protein
MMRYQRPILNPTFDGRVQKERERIRTAIEAGQVPKIDKSLWRDFKRDFSAQQQGKCGYCEANVMLTHFGDVEHFAPKNEVAEFNAGDNEGSEIDHLATLQGRSPSLKVAPGYWWLAYDWNNYLLSCGVCNEVWKSSIFPVKHPPPRAGAPREIDAESVLLLNPFGTRDPARHLKFDITGSVMPRNSSIYGRETIRTCGLNRLALRNARQPVAERAFAAVVDAQRAEQEGVAPEDNEGLQDLHRMGQDGPTAVFPGMVRAIILTELEPLTWVLLDQLFSDPG